MVRRWSHVNSFTLSLVNFNQFFKISYVLIFKSSVNYKTPAFSYTKLKRRKLSRWKHRSVWLPYLHIIKAWVEDLRFQRKLIVYQFLSKIFQSNYIFYNSQYLRSRYLRLFSVNLNIVHFTINKKILWHFCNMSFSPLSSFYRNLNITFAHVLHKQDDLPQHNFLLTQYFENLTYGQIGTTPSVEFPLEMPHVNVFLQNVVEIYKILLIIFHHSLYVKSICF